jgi:Ser/Thr protein kinase RdoA (MazF antagonist)
VTVSRGRPGTGNRSQQAPLPPPYEGLTPEVVLAAVESLGLVTDGRLLALNSYENRVYRVGLEDGELPGGARGPVVAKFYRAGRWSDAQIREEHAFAVELACADLAVAEPLAFAGRTLHEHAGFRFTLFANRPGSAPDLDRAGDRALLGRTMGRMHVVGARSAFRHRGSVRDWRCGARARDAVLQAGRMPPQLEAAYADTADALVAAIAQGWEAAAGWRALRLHGDCHPGNILWTAQGPLFVDFDDALMGPAVQDLWMYAAGSPRQMQREWTELLEGYEQFAHFDVAEAGLVEVLRAERMLNHAAWIAQRWDDPAFPRAFPWFGEARYWERHIDELREQREAVEDPPLFRAVG